MRITKKITSIVLAVLMVVSMMSVMAVSASAAEETSTVTWDNNSLQKTSGGKSSGGVTLTTEQAQTRVNDCFYSGRGTATFTAPEGSVFTKIELRNCRYINSLNFPGATVANDGGYWEGSMWDDEAPKWVSYYTVTWTGESSEVTFSGAIYGIQSIVFTLKSTAPAIPTISNATELSNACINGGEYNLAADITTEYNYVEKDTIIHGNGHTITSGSDYSIFYWDNDKDADLTLDNVTLDGNGKKGIAVDVTTYSTDASNNSGCNVTFDTVTCKNFASDYPEGVGAVYLYGKSNGTFTNCTFTGNTVSTTGTNGFNGADIWFGGAGNLSISGGSYNEVYVNGGSASAAVSNGAQIASMAAVSTSTVAVTGSTVSKLYVADKNNVTVDAQSTVSILNGFKPTEDEVLDEYPAVAQIGTTNYGSLAKAFAAAKDGDTITVLADCAGDGIKVTPAGKFSEQGLTVDFNGHTYTVDGETVGSTGTETNGFQLLKNNKVTFTNGTITSAKAKILVQNYSDLELEGMTLTLNNPNYTSAYTLSNNNGEVTINDTTINANPKGGFAFDVCRFSTYPSVSVNVIGGSVINGNVEVSASKSDPKDGFQLFLTSGTLNGNIVLDQTAKNVLDNADPEKVAIVKFDTFDQAAPEGYMWVDTATEGVQTLAKAVAQIGTTKYATLEAAFAAAQDGETITVLADCAGNGIKAPQGKFSTGLTVDFDGHTYTVIANTVGSTGTETQAFQLLKDNKITFQNGTITSSVAKMLVQNYSNLTLDNMVLDGRNLVGSGRYTLSNNNGNVVINDTTIYAKGGKGSGNYAFDVCRYSSYPSVNVTVKGGSEINGDVEISASKGDAKDGFSLTLEGGTMDGNIIVDASAKSLVGEENKVTKAAAFTQTAPEGFKWEDNGNNTSKLVAKTLQDDVDANFSVEDIADVHFVDGAGQSVEIVSKAQILGVQLRRPAHDGVYTDGAANGIRFITAVDKEFLNEHPEIVNYGYNVTIKGVTRFFSVKGTTNNVIETDDNDYNYYTFAITNIPEDNSDEIKVQFVFTTNGTNIAAKAAYKNASGAVSHELVTNYADVKNY